MKPVVDLEQERRLRELADIARKRPRVGAFVENLMPEEIAVRLAPELAERADALVPVLADDPRLRRWGRVSRASVVRMALDMGLTLLERERSPDEPDARLVELARQVAPFVDSELHEAARLTLRLFELTGRVVGIYGRPGEDPPWVVAAPGGEPIAGGPTPVDAALAALQRLQGSE